MQARRSWDLAAVTLSAWLAGCGGKGVSTPDSATAGSSMYGAAAGDSGPPPGAFAGSPGVTGGTPGDFPGRAPGGAAGGSGGAAPSMPPGQCTALCVPSASFVVTDVGADELFSHSFEACRNRECYRGGPFDASSQGNTIYLTGGISWDQTSVSLFYDRSAAFSLNLSWQLPAYGQEFRDGDHYTLTSLAGSHAAATLIDTVVNYEHFTICGSACTRAYVPDLVRPPLPAGGAGGTDGLGDAGNAGESSAGGSTSD